MGTGAIARHFVVNIFVIILVTTSAAFAAIVPISDIPMQTVQGYRSSPPYGWTYAFDIGFSNLELNVGINIRLVGANPGASLLSVWENGIQNMWSRRYDIIDETGGPQYDHFHYHVNFDVVFPVDPSASVHHTVTVITGQGGGNMLTWYTTSEWGSAYNGPYVAHEVGHMFSLYDEYPGGAQDPASPIVDYGSIMGSLAAGAKERHYEPFLDWLQQMAPGRELTIGPYDPDWVIPEPCTLLLLCLGMLVIERRRSKR
jgi:hypothetical protein